MTAIKAYANCDRAHVVWQLDGRVENCLGFALYRREGTEDDLQPDEAHATDWSNETMATAAAGDGYSAYFNRGILASQWVSRKLQELGGKEIPTLEDAISKPGPIREFLAGSVLPKLPSLLQGASTIYAALYELNDPELIEHLVQLGPKA